MPLPRIPALPNQWPYVPKKFDAELHTSSPHSIPLQGGGWTLCLRAGISISGVEETLPDAHGRGGVFRLGDTVLRPYRRGGLVRHVNQSTYGSTARFRTEFEMHAWLFAQGFPTVEPLGYGFRRKGLGYQGLYLTRWSEARPWPKDWTQNPAFLDRLRAAIAALTSVGCWAPDLNATNVLVTSTQSPLLLDWDRAAFLPEEALLGRYQQRLARSLQKLQAPIELLQDWLPTLADAHP